MKMTWKNYTRILTGLIIVLFSQQINAQTWQWGRTGGSIFNGLNANPYEAVIDITTDKSGNVYGLALIEATSPVTVAGQLLTTYGQKDLLVFKYDCNGNYKWGKVIGGPERDFPGAIGTDTLGHVYVSGSVVPAAQTTSQNQIHFSTDTIQAITNGKTLFLIQYDTAGTFQWLRQPNPDTAGSVANVTISKRYAMDVSPNGDVYWLVLLNPGLVSGGGGWAANTISTHILKYNVNGLMADHIPIQLDLSKAKMNYTNMVRTGSGRFIFAGSQEIVAATNNILTIGGQNVNHTMFLASFSASGQLQWKRENSTAAYLRGRIFNKPLVDDHGNIYFAGTSFEGDSFNTYHFHNSLTTIANDMPFISKADSNGNHIWTKVAGANSANLNNSLAFRNPAEIWLSGTSNSLSWDSLHRFEPNGNLGYQFYVSRFDTGGHLLSLDTLLGTYGNANLALSSAADKRGNLYIGGQLGGDMSIGGQLHQNNGGETDFLLAKFGYANCSCTSGPVAVFTNNLNGRTITLTYTGTGSADSIRWNFGNGISAVRSGSQIQTPYSYTYPIGMNGPFNLCVTVYNSCGMAQNCQTINLASTMIGGVSGAQVVAFPNPADDIIHVNGATIGTMASLFNLIGQQQITPTVLTPEYSINTRVLSPGYYLLILTGKDGQKTTFRILKQ